MTLEINDVPLSLCNDLSRPNLRMISWSSFLPPPQPSQPRWKSLQSILWMYLSWLIGIYTLEKLASGWSPSVTPLLGRSHIVGQAGPVGIFKFLGVYLIGKWDKKRSLAIWSPVWRPVLLKDLYSNLWRAFSPKWVVTCKELTNFHWRFPGRKRSSFFWNHPIWSS